MQRSFSSLAASSALSSSSALVCRMPIKVSVHEWNVERFCKAKDFLSTVCEKGPWNKQQWESMMWHGGLYVDRVRIVDEKVPLDVCAGCKISAYWYEQEPPKIVLDSSHICFDHNGIVAINKPSSLSLSGSRVSNKLCLEYLARKLLQQPSLQAIHRLDTGTSGLVLFGKTKPIVRDLSAQFETRQIKKEYLALVSPQAPSAQWSVKGNQFLSRHPSGAKHSFFEFESTDTSPNALLPSKQTNFLTHATNKQYGHTDFEVLDNISDQFSLVRAYPTTGRTHQIRLHLQAAGCPIVGDWLYGPEQDPIWDEQQQQTTNNHKPAQGVGFYSSYRLQLHAHAATISIRGKPWRIISEPSAKDGWLTAARKM